MEMTREDFVAAQAALGLSNARMAEALGASVELVEKMRSGKRAVSPRTAAMVRLLLRQARRPGAQGEGTP